MRGILMEKKNNKIIVMTNDGQFLEIKNYNKSAEIGQEISFSNNISYNQSFVRKAISIAAAFLFIVAGSYGAYGYYMPFGYVDVDINPSVELSYNLYDRVIEIKGLNEDGTNVVAKIKDYKNKPVKDIITKVIDSAIEENYIKPEQQNAILVTITEDGSKINDQEIFQSVDDHMKEEKLETEVVLVKSDKQQYETAKKNNLTPGKLMLINKALDSSNEISQQDMQNKSVKEIMSIINQNKKEDKKEDKKEEKNIKLGIKYQNNIEKASQKDSNKNEKDNKNNNKNNRNHNSESINKNPNKSNDSNNNGKNNRNINSNGKNSENAQISDLPKENSKDNEKQDDDSENENKGNGKALKEDSSKNNKSDKNNNDKYKQGNGNSNNSNEKDKNKTKP